MGSDCAGTATSASRSVSRGVACAICRWSETLLRPGASLRFERADWSDESSASCGAARRRPRKSGYSFSRLRLAAAGTLSAGLPARAVPPADCPGQSLSACRVRLEAQPPALANKARATRNSVSRSKPGYVTRVVPQDAQDATAVSVLRAALSRPHRLQLLNRSEVNHRCGRSRGVCRFRIESRRLCECGRSKPNGGQHRFVKL